MTKQLHAAIAEHAYYLWLDEGMKHGKAEHHWMMAETLLATKAPVAAAPRAKKTSTKSAPRAKARPATMALHS